MNEAYEIPEIEPRNFALGLLLAQEKLVFTVLKVEQLTGRAAKMALKLFTVLTLPGLLQSMQSPYICINEIAYISKRGKKRVHLENNYCAACSSPRQVCSTYSGVLTSVISVSLFPSKSYFQTLKDFFTNYVPAALTPGCFS